MMNQSDEEDSVSDRDRTSSVDHDVIDSSQRNNVKGAAMTSSFSDKKPNGGLLAMLENEAWDHTQTDAISMTSQMTCEYMYNDVNAVDYHSSNFPSLLNRLGKKTSSRSSFLLIPSDKPERKTRLPLEKQDTKTRLPSDEQDRKNRLSPNEPERKTRLPQGIWGTLEKSKPKKKTQKKSTSSEKDYNSFGERMKQNNFLLWERIENKSRERMKRYDQWVEGMDERIRKQRLNIKRRSQQLLQSLEDQENQKREERMFASPHGRMWRHHRSMQRRAFSLEPMKQPKLDSIDRTPERKRAQVIW
ncbi:uncharacterized protein LOC128240708 isoform X1 [Mya arenaria]|uniref:uncharacterized protein LOC128240708 isoform X1 n=1 Tax=Mya arenaria TaxID=6604 RepID=UPI0022E3ED86|nr:uncharacterized protein LOC128240708 isoform X1 [Mya arenaria]